MKTNGKIIHGTHLQILETVFYQKKIFIFLLMTYYPSLTGNQREKYSKDTPSNTNNFILATHNLFIIFLFITYYLG